MVFGELFGRLLPFSILKFHLYVSYFNQTCVCKSLLVSKQMNKTLPKRGQHFCQSHYYNYMLHPICIPEFILHTCGLAPTSRLPVTHLHLARPRMSIHHLVCAEFRPSCLQLRISCDQERLKRRKNSTFLSSHVTASTRCVSVLSRSQLRRRTNVQPAVAYA